MSTHCQIGFYETHEQPLNRPSVLIYRHSDGYPNGESGVMIPLHEWARKFKRHRELEGVDYAAARGLVALMRASDLLGEEEVLGYGICTDKVLLYIDYFYRVDPSGVYCYQMDKEFDLDGDSYEGLRFLFGQLL